MNQYNSQSTRKEYRTIQNIKEKLDVHKALILKADKGNTLVIEYADHYCKKIHDFISNNQLQTINKDPTNKFQNKIRTVLKDCRNLITQESRPKYINLNPTHPSIRGLLKIHKDQCPIRPIVNWTNAPAYKLSKLLNHLLKTHIPLPYVYNVKNTPQLMYEINEIPYNSHLRLASLDIDNMYTNIPTDLICKIIDRMCMNVNVNQETTNSLIKITHTIIQQNYFEFLNKCYLQSKGLAMGAPSSSILSEIISKIWKAPKFLK
jgi:hypothetical protein